MSGNYLKSGAVTLLSRIIFTVSTLGSLWFLSHILPKDGFGLFMLAYTMVMLVGGVVASGFHGVILYHISRATEKAKHVAGTVFVSGAIVGGLGGLCLYEGAALVAQGIFNKPDLAHWFQALSILIPLEVVKMMLLWYHRAEKRIALSVLGGESLPALLRIIALCLIYLIWNNPSLIVPGFIAAHVVTIIVLMPWRRFVDLRPSARAITKWDIGYGGKISLNALVNQPSRAFDMILAGVLVTAEAMADYALASRLAMFLLMGKQIFLPLLTPRIGHHLSTGNVAALKDEYNASRYIGFSLCLLGVLGFMIVGPFVLSLFGDGYGGAYNVFLALALSMMIRVAAGADGEVLNLSGHAGWTLASTLLSLGVFIALGLSFVDSMGMVGIAYALAVSMALTHGLILTIIYLKEKIPLFNVIQGGVLMMAIIIILAGQFDIIAWDKMAAGFAIVTTGYILCSGGWKSAKGFLTSNL